MLREEEDGSPLGIYHKNMQLGLPKMGKYLGWWFSFAGFFGVLPAFTANQLTQTVITVVDPDRYFALGNSTGKYFWESVFCSHQRLGYTRRTPKNCEGNLCWSRLWFCFTSVWECLF